MIVHTRYISFFLFFFCKVEHKAVRRSSHFCCCCCCCCRTSFRGLDWWGLRCVDVGMPLTAKNKTNTTCPVHDDELDDMRSSSSASTTTTTSDHDIRKQNARWTIPASSADLSDPLSTPNCCSPDTCLCLHVFISYMYCCGKYYTHPHHGLRSSFYCCRWCCCHAAALHLERRRPQQRQLPPQQQPADTRTRRDHKGVATNLTSPLRNLLLARQRNTSCTARRLIAMPYLILKKCILVPQVYIRGREKKNMTKNRWSMINQYRNQDKKGKKRSGEKWERRNEYEYEYNQRRRSAKNTRDKNRHENNQRKKKPLE